jgi:hypothetical protein
MSQSLDDPDVRSEEPAAHRGERLPVTGSEEPVRRGWQLRGAGEA